MQSLDGPDQHEAAAGGLAPPARQRRQLDAVRLEFLAERSSDGIFVQVFRPESRIAIFNPVMERITGYSREEVRADPSLLVDAISEEDRARLSTAADLPDRSTGQSADAVEVELRGREGQRRHVRVRGMQIRDGHGHAESYQATVTDVTGEHREREAMRLALEHQRELNELKTNFVQAVSHELRAPLTTIRGFVELLLVRDLPREEQRRYLRRIAAGSDRLHRLVRDVLDLDRLDGKGQVIHEMSVDLAEISRRVIDDTEVGTHLLHLDVRETMALCDEALIERVIDNLVRNAIKHTPERTSIWIRTRPPATIIVEDDGPGIPAGLRDRLFEPFERGPDQSEHHAPGVGIGLTLVRRIIHLHGGEVTIGDRPGGGALFTISLPVS